MAPGFLLPPPLGFLQYLFLHDWRLHFAHFLASALVDPEEDLELEPEDLAGLDEALGAPPPPLQLFLTHDPL